MVKIIFFYLFFCRSLNWRSLLETKYKESLLQVWARMLKSNRKRETPVVTIYNNLYFYRNLTAHKTYQKYKLIAIFVWAIYFKIVHMYRNKYCLVGSVSQYFYIFFLFLAKGRDVLVYIWPPKYIIFIFHRNVGEFSINYVQWDSYHYHPSPYVL